MNYLGGLCVSAVKRAGSRFLIWRVSRCAGLFLLLLCCVTLAAQAQETAKATHTFTFGQTATFSLALSPGAAVTEATLFVTVNRENTRLYPVTLENNQGQYQRDLRTEPFPPYARITYRWQFINAQGVEETTNETHFLYDDNRFRWQPLEKDGVTLNWVSGDKALMVNALDIALNAIANIEQTLLAPHPESITLYIYPSLPDLQSALRLSGRDWVGGRAYPELGVVLLAIPPGDGAVIQMKRDIPHEIAHQILYDLVGPQGYETLPVWLNEGLVSHFEQYPDAAYALALEKATQSATLIPFEKLCYPFSADREQAILSYAQSQSMVSYIQQTYGWSKVRTLVQAYADGLGCNVGVQRVLDTDMTTLDREWRLWLSTKGQTPAQPAWDEVLLILGDLAPWLLLIGGVCLPSVVLFVEHRLRAWQRG
ncbi:MAG TPA: peptidase MA family metallohydrolase [Anaerolineae bacterium]|nr:peptidase MA family metallohydrolase [Anaerolineae bacterium]